LTHGRTAPVQFNELQLRNITVLTKLYGLVQLSLGYQRCTTGAARCGTGAIKRESSTVYAGLVIIILNPTVYGRCTPSCLLRGVPVKQWESGPYLAERSIIADIRQCTAGVQQVYGCPYCTVRLAVGGHLRTDWSITYGLTSLCRYPTVYGRPVCRCPLRYPTVYGGVQQCTEVYSRCTAGYGWTGRWPRNRPGPPLDAVAEGPFMAMGYGDALARAVSRA